VFGQMSRIFLSHSSLDNAEAIAIHDWLIEQGWNELFLDLDAERGIKAGQRWQEALKRAADHCELVLFLISPQWVASKWCLAEFLLAKQLNKRIFGILIAATPRSEIPTEMTSQWQLADLTKGRLSEEFNVKLPHDEGERTVAFSGEGLHRLRLGLMQAGIDPKFFEWPPANDPCRVPYRGLRALDADDAGIFFGREGPIVVGLDMLRGLRDAAPPRLAVILGASGAGKSSFMRAGLLPRLNRESHNFLPLPVVRPERAVMTGESGLTTSLEQAFSSVGAPRARVHIRATLDEGGDSFNELLATLANAKLRQLHLEAGEAPEPPCVVISIDQAEELFDADGAEESNRCLSLLRHVVQHDDPAVIVLFTIRSDKYESLQTAPSLSGIRQHPLSLLPMPRGTYSKVIEGPALRLAGTNRAFVVEEPLVNALLRDLDDGDCKDALPLLAFSLERLFREFHGSGRLSLEDYRKLGGIRGSIEAAVANALDAAEAIPAIPRDPKERLGVLRRGLIPWLASVDPDTGAPRRRVARRSEIPEESRPLIDLLLVQRLLTSDKDEETGEETIEPAHEALLRQWSVLEGWLKEDAGKLSAIDEIKRSSRDWVANGRESSWLAHSADRLKFAESLLERPDLAARLNSINLEYLASCRAAEAAAASKEKAVVRNRQRMMVTVVVLLFGIIVGLIAFINQQPLKEFYVWQLQMRPSILDGNDERALAAKPGAKFSDCSSHCPRMVVIPTGNFLMGTADEWSTDEFPQHEVTITRPFAVSETEVTFDQWDACVSAGVCEQVSDDGWGRNNRPVIYVTWFAARKYAAWLSRKTGKHYRLPTETEWEYAARAGGSTKWSFGDDESQLAKYAWYEANSGGKTHPVGTKEPNAFGLHDMHGNVWEWVEDCYAHTYEGAPSVGIAWSDACTSEMSDRAIRGGSYFRVAGETRSANRTSNRPDGRNKAVGFRIVRTLGDWSK
jgi:formylglycine-generating enzyme required for sulfatase activity